MNAAKLENRSVGMLDSRGRPIKKWRSRSIPIKEKMYARIKEVNDCWHWDVVNKATGYGELTYGGVRWLAHRLSYEIHVGQIPEGLQIDHLCRNRDCVNPDHLRTATIRENVLCGEGITAKNAKKTHCKRGHEFTPENTAAYKKSNGSTWRACKICRDAASRKSAQKIKLSPAPCVECGGEVTYKGSQAPKTCSRSCGVKLSHKTTPRRPPNKERAACRICGGPANAKELCGKHYMAAKRRGDL